MTSSRVPNLMLSAKAPTLGVFISFVAKNRKDSTNMAFTVSTEAESAYLVITAAGPAGLGELVGLVALAGAVATHRGAKRALLNFAKVEPELPFTERLQFGVEAAGLLGRLEKVAAVVPPGYLDAPSARAAQLSGLHVRTFLDLADAAAWIQAPVMVS